MSGMICPHCQQKIDLFKTGGGKIIAEEMNIPFIGAIPLDPQLVMSTDEGEAYVLRSPDSAVAGAFNQVADIWKRHLENKKAASK
jgi:septum formation inhibitor-activating ATPase MinD